jgi:hypothetical protein
MKELLESLRVAEKTHVAEGTGDPEEGWCVIGDYDKVVAGPFLHKSDAKEWLKKNWQYSDNTPIRWGKRAADDSNEYVATRAVNPTEEVNEASQALQYHVVSKLDGRVLASYATKQEAEKNAHGNPVLAGDLETIGDVKFVREYQKTPATEAFGDPLTGYHIVYKNSGNVVHGTPSFEKQDDAQKYLMQKMFANHHLYKVVDSK